MWKAISLRHVEIKSRQGQHGTEELNDSILTANYVQILTHFHLNHRIFDAVPLIMHSARWFDEVKGRTNDIAHKTLARMNIVASTTNTTSDVFAHELINCLCEIHHIGDSKEVKAGMAALFSKNVLSKKPAVFSLKFHLIAWLATCGCGSAWKARTNFWVRIVCAISLAGTVVVWGMSFRFSWILWWVLTNYPENQISLQKSQKN